MRGVRCTVSLGVCVKVALQSGGGSCVYPGPMKREPGFQRLEVQSTLSHRYFSTGVTLLGVLRFQARNLLVSKNEQIRPDCQSVPMVGRESGRNRERPSETESVSCRVHCAAYMAQCHTVHSAFQTLERCGTGRARLSRCPFLISIWYLRSM